MRREANRFWSVASDVELSRFQLGGAFPRHFHLEAVVVLVEDGAEALILQRESLVGERGTVLLLEPGRVHENRAVDRSGVTYRSFYLLDREQTDLEPEAGALGERRIRCARTFDRLVALHRALETDAAAVPAAVVRSELRALFEDRAIEGGVGGRSYVRDAVHILRRRFAENLPLSELASMVGVAPTHLARRFHEEVGLPPHAYRDGLRVAHARRLIRERVPLARVAIQCGLYDQSHLVRRFSRIMGQTPGAYRTS